MLDYNADFNLFKQDDLRYKSVKLDKNEKDFNQLLVGKFEKEKKG